MLNDLTDTERKLLERVLTEHRMIMAKTGYGKIELSYTNKEIEIVSGNTIRLKVA